MIFGYRQIIFPNKKLPYQGQKSCRKILWILNTLPNGVTHYHNTWIVVFFMFIIVEYINKLQHIEYHQNPAQNSSGVWNRVAVRPTILMAYFPYRSPFILRSSSVQAPFNLRSSSVQPPFNLRSSSVRAPFILRSTSVQPPFVLRSTSVRSPFNLRST